MTGRLTVAILLVARGGVDRLMAAERVGAVTGGTRDEAVLTWVIESRNRPRLAGLGGCRCPDLVSAMRERQALLDDLGDFLARRDQLKDPAVDLPVSDLLSSVSVMT
jgi:hypothetical protein